PGARRFDVACGLGARPDGLLRSSCTLCACKAPACSNSCSVIAMDTILVVNAGSSRVKFPVFSVEGEGTPRPLIKGQMDGIGSRPRLRASGPTGDPMADRAYPIEAVASVPAAIAGAGGRARHGTSVH